MKKVINVIGKMIAGAGVLVLAWMGFVMIMHATIMQFIPHPYLDGDQTFMPKLCAGLLVTAFVIIGLSKCIPSPTPNDEGQIAKRKDAAQSAPRELTR